MRVCYSVGRDALGAPLPQICNATSSLHKIGTPARRGRRALRIAFVSNVKLASTKKTVVSRNAVHQLPNHRRSWRGGARGRQLGQFR